jgi:hypothetical protein
MTRSLLPLLIAFAVTPVALAFEARTPIWEPTTIDEAGAYVLTRDLQGTGALITITADGVELDLNGHRLIGVGSATVLSIAAAENVWVHGGTLSGGGVSVSGSVAVWLERLEIEAPRASGIYSSSSSAVSIRECAITAAGSDGISTRDPGPFLINSVVLSRADSDGLSMSSPLGSLVSGLTIVVAPVFASSGVSLYTADGNSLSDIRIDGAGGDGAVDVFGAAGSRFSEIHASSCDGDAFSIFDPSEDSLWERNGAVGCADGISVFSNRTVLRLNQFSGNDSGIEIFGDDNVISGNVSRGNAIGDYYVSGLSTGNTSAGNNFVPNRQ